MRKKRKNFILLSILCVFLIQAVTVFASETDKSVVTKIPVFCYAENCDESFTYRLVGEDNYPTQQVKSDTISLVDNTTGTFDIVCTYPGTYHYKVTQDSGYSNNTTYDTSTYSADVYVTENEDGVLSAETTVYLNGSNEKKASCYFMNYKSLSQSQIPHASGSSGSSIPEIKDVSSTIPTVETGDNSNISYWATVFFGASLILILILLTELKRKNSR